MTCYPSVDAILFNEQASAVPDYDAGPPIVRGVKAGQVAFYLKQDGQWYTRAYNEAEQVWETGGSGSVAWDDVTGKPAEYNPSAHTHVWSEMIDTGWTSVSFLGAWGNYNSAYDYAAYMRRDNMVYLRGIVAGGSPMSSNIFRLPSACRPTRNHLLATIGSHAGMTLYIYSDGYVRTAADSTGTWRSLNCQFPID